MKKIVTASLIALAAVSSFAFVKVETKGVSAASLFPDVIDLNDSTETEIRNYYSGLNSLSDTERQGTNLLKNLKPILKENHTTFSYGSSATTAVWQAYEIVDRDWALSPASEISGYNASTNTITGYVFGESNSNVGSNPYIHALYVNRDKTNGSKAWGDHSQTAYGINQEHIWPKSLGFNDNGNPSGARGDLMHLWAGNGDVNGHFHNNYFYGYVDKTKTYKDAKDKQDYLAGNLLGFSKTLGGSTNVFEPQNSDKGDIARAVFYMMARYNYLANDGDTIDSGNPNLEIVNDLTSFSQSGYTSSQTTTGKIGVLQDLLEWNKLDPVDEFEIHRNNLLYKNFSHNRNPFIDFPEWADYIWGTSSNGTYNPAINGKANPASDVISKVESESSGGSSSTSTSTPTSTSPSDEPSTSSDEKEPLDLKTIIIIGVAVVIGLIVIIAIVAGLSKKNKKKIKKAAKKQIKKSVKSNRKK